MYSSVREVESRVLTCQDNRFRDLYYTLTSRTMSRYGPQPWTIYKNITYLTYFSDVETIWQEGCAKDGIIGQSDCTTWNKDPGDIHEASPTTVNLGVSLHPISYFSLSSSTFTRLSFWVGIDLVIQVLGFYHTLYHTPWWPLGLLGGPVETFLLKSDLERRRS